MFCCEIWIFELGFVLYELSHANHNHIQALVRTLGVFLPLQVHKTYLSAQHDSRPKTLLTIVDAMLWRPVIFPDKKKQKTLHLNISSVLQGNSCRHPKGEPEQKWQNHLFSHYMDKVWALSKLNLRKPFFF